MAYTSGAKAKVSPGDLVRAEHHNGLVDIATAIQLQRGRLKGRQYPDGFHAHVKAEATLTFSHAFKMTVDELDGDKVAVRFSLGTVDGSVPQIDGKEIDEIDESGDIPALLVADEAWVAHGKAERALIYFRYELNKSFEVAKVVPVAAAKKPDSAPWQWHKLVGFLTRYEGAVRPTQIAFFPMRFEVVDPKPQTGRFQPLPHL